MSVADYLELGVKYGLNNVLMVFLLLQFIKTTKELAKVINKNSIAMAEVFVVIQDCKKNDRQLTKNNN